MIFFILVLTTNNLFAIQDFLKYEYRARISCKFYYLDENGGVKKTLKIDKDYYDKKYDVDKKPEDGGTGYAGAVIPIKSGDNSFYIQVEADSASFKPDDIKMNYNLGYAARRNQKNK